MAPHSLQQDVPLISAWPCNTALPTGTLAIRAHFPIYKEHLLAALHHGNADGKHCSNACVPELRFITAEVEVPNGTAPFCSQFLHLCMYHHVCMCVCVCVFGQVVWFEFVRTSQQLNAPFCNQFLPLCMYHQVCMCVCVSSARLCDLSVSELVSN